MTTFLDYWLPGLLVVIALLVCVVLHWKFDR